MIKSLVTHKVEDVLAWKEAFVKHEEARKNAGMISASIGNLHGDPSHVYILSEWPDAETMNNFLSNPAVMETMKNGGVISKPEVMILETFN